MGLSTNGQTAWNLTVSCRKRWFFYRHPSKIEIIINRQGVSNLTISGLIFKDFWLLKNLYQKHSLSLDITRRYNVLKSENVATFHKWKAKTTFKAQQLMLINTEINIFLNSWTKFPLVTNRQKL